MRAKGVLARVQAGRRCVCVCVCVCACARMRVRRMRVRRMRARRMRVRRMREVHGGQQQRTSEGGDELADELVQQRRVQAAQIVQVR